MKCLKEDPEAMKFFKSLPDSHQKYFIKWIEGAKTASIKTKRIVTCLTAFSKKMNYVFRNGKARSLPHLISSVTCGSLEAMSRIMSCFILT
jgi:hypothetical protein